MELNPKDSMTNKSCVKLHLMDQILYLYAGKYAFWEKHRMLLLCDLHLGKSSHFRSAGIAIPREVNFDNMTRLEMAINETNAQHVLILGDLFHSKWNQNFEDLTQLLDRYPSVTFELVLGNHDILEIRTYHEAGILTSDKNINMLPFTFTHEPFPESKYFNIHGHIHPGIRLQGKAKQSLKFPCFYIDGKSMILPAFGSFTGNHILPMKKDVTAYFIADDAIYRWE